MDHSKANLYFKLFCDAKYDHRNAISSLEFELVCNQKIFSPFYLCFTCLAYFTGARTEKIQYEKIGSFFRIELSKNRKEWKFSIHDISYQFSSITDSPQNPFVDINERIIDNVEVIFSSDYVPEVEENLYLEAKITENYFPVFPQVNNISNVHGNIDLHYGFNIKNINANKANFILRSTLKNFESMLDDEGIQVDCRLDETVKGYEIDHNRQKIIIKSEDECHELYAFLTLGQIWHHSKKKPPYFLIRDRAEYQWRGLLIDTVRRFYTIPELKKLILFLALLKLNKLQLHLSNDEGWRMENSSYPQLNRYGSYSGYKLKIKPHFLSASHEISGGFYTKEEIYNLINYAKRFYIDIVPEFNLLAHAHAILQSLPQLIEKEDHSSYISVQGYTQNTLNPALSSTWEFIDNIIHEYNDIFPFCYFHVGFDERPEGSWKASPACQELMRNNNLKTMGDLQTYAANKVADILKRYGKKTAFWEEAAKGDLNDRSTLIFSWSNEEITEELVEKGYQIVASPAQSFYFDIREKNRFDSPGLHWVDSLSIDKVYLAEVVCHPNVMGIQCALWGETLTSQYSVYKMLFPRLLAFSEVAWTRNNRRNLAQFKKHVDCFMEGELSFFN